MQGVDGLEPQGPQATLVAGLEPSGDLFGGPCFRKTTADESPQRRIFLEYGFTPPAQLIGSGGVKRRITPAGQGVASQFPRYGGFAPTRDPEETPSLKPIDEAAHWQSPGFSLSCTGRRVD